MKLTIKNYRCFEDSKPLKISIKEGFLSFVGPNNAGKSFVLRFFYEFRGLFSFLSSNSGGLTEAFHGREVNIDLKDVNDPEEVFSNLNDRGISIEIELEELATEPEKNDSLTKICISVDRKPVKFRVTELQSNRGRINFATKVPETVRWLSLGLVELSAGPSLRFDFSSFFQECESIRKSIYIASFRNAINIGGMPNYFDISVGTEFIKKWKEWKSGPNKFKNDVIQRVQFDIKEIFKFQSLEIIDASDLNTLQIYVDGKSYKLNELGSGIAQFIIVLGNAAIAQPDFIFIDEPELHLHPSLQLKFLTTLISYSKKGVIFATHSIGLARSVADRIYSINRDKEGRAVVRDLEETPRLPEFLGELSFRSFKDIGCDKILLVEGVHELKTIQQFIRKLKKDTEIVLLPLGGSSMINGKRELELAEIKRISKNISALIDSEKRSKDSALSKGRKEFVEICKESGVKIHVLERRAIENYFTEKSIQNIKGKSYSALSAYQALGDIDPTWAKSENWRIAKEMSFEEIKDTDLGKFLKSIL